MNASLAQAAKRPTSRRLGAAAALPSRSRSVDALRGWSILLMVVAHGDVWLGILPGFNDTVGRLAMPGFMLAAGYCWSGRWSSRWLLVIGAAILTTVLFRWAGLVEFPILHVFVLVAPVVVLLRRWPFALVLLGFLQLQSAPLHWSGFEPGAVLLWLGLGLWIRATYPWFPVTVPAPGWVVSMGRYPLAWYVLHIYVLWLLWAMLG